MAKTVKSIKGIIESLLLVSVFAGLIVYREEISRGVWDGIIYSLSALLPSLLPFMFLSSVLSRRPLYGILCRALSPITRHLFRLPSVCGGAVISGLLFGYPVGAKMTAELFEGGEISRDEAARMLDFCVSPGIAFCILFLGGEVFGSFASGLLLFVSISISCIACGFVLSFGSVVPEKKKASVKQESFVVSLDHGIGSTARACLTMVMYIVVFRAAFALLEATKVTEGIPEKVRSILYFLLEVTAGINEAARACASVSIFAFGLGFGGICLIFQLLSFFRESPASFTAVLGARLFHGLLSGIIAHFLVKLFPFTGKSLEVFSTNGVKIPGGMDAEPLGFAFLVLLFGAYILSGSKIGVEKRNKR